MKYHGLNPKIQDSFIRVLDQLNHYINDEKLIAIRHIIMHLNVTVSKFKLKIEVIFSQFQANSTYTVVEDM
jgi:hypothetical protein